MLMFKSNNKSVGYGNRCSLVLLLVEDGRWSSREKSIRLLGQWWKWRLA